jgi:protein-tyrosine-phosphatase
MGVMRSESGYDRTFGLIAKRLREDSEQVTQEPMPTRWVDLILYLDEQEHKTRLRPQPSARELRAIEAKIAVSNQEKVLQELMRIEEPTEEAAALLEDLRRKVAQAVAPRN